MQRTNSLARILFLGPVAGMFILLGACQGPSQQAGAGNQLAEPSTKGTTAVAPISSYTPGTAPAKLISYCNLEAVGAVAFQSGPVELTPRKQIVFKGWIDASELTKPSYWLRFDDQSANRYLQAPVTLMVPRPDVASAHAGAPLISGFSQTLPVNGLPAGRYHVYIVVSSDGETYTCDNGRHVEVNS